MDGESGGLVDVDMAILEPGKGEDTKLVEQYDRENDGLESKGAATPIYGPI